MEKKEAFTLSTSIVFVEGKCGLKAIRVKQWKYGFSIKCMRKKKTLVGRPFDKEMYLDDLKMFCVGCQEIKP